MRIYTKAGDLAFKTFTFPDNQPHFKLETYEREFDTVTVETAIKTPADLLLVLLVAEVLRNAGYSVVNLDVRYLLSARMDRAISWAEPFSLQVVARLLNGAGFSRVRILDVHSEVATKLIRNSSTLVPLKVAQQALLASGASVLVSPDRGASYRVQQVWFSCPGTTIIYCEKTRDPNTGALSGFKVKDYEPEKDGTSVLIVDDICDGGRTFVGLAEELRKSGAKKVNLFVTHGIFSKGVPLEGIDRIFTTDSVIDPFFNTRGVTVIPISMKEL